MKGLEFAKQRAPSVVRPSMVIVRMTGETYKGDVHVERGEDVGRDDAGVPGVVVDLLERRVQG